MSASAFNTVSTLRCLHTDRDRDHHQIRYKMFHISLCGGVDTTLRPTPILPISLATNPLIGIGLGLCHRERTANAQNDVGTLTL